MSTFLMFGKYTPEAIKAMSVQRTQQAVQTVERFGGEVQSMYATLGPYDLVFVTTFPDLESAMKASVGLSKLTSIALTTSPAVAVTEFDQMMGEV